ncbi:PfkB family carbohydrate kinase [Ideonella oryzae]|uniref:PfkB family carbohydrate kinase n=1 Tax=Ideonella oryzae TaxID=2937441 RepID=A0ABT1BLN5_9BURK|nr:PfkB family carbohydrate kinase [Ideonella oryzae]MCO5977133.1 PfkB family carbohydrate kinase [Ideonella oryzae]
MPHPPAAAPSAPVLHVLGEGLMDCFAEPDGRLRPRMGGSPFNLARAAARQGRAVRWLTPFSTDAFGQTLRRQALADGILPGSPVSALPTALAVVSFEGEATRYGFYREGIADRDWSPASVLAALADHPPGVLHTGSLMLVPPQHAATLAVMDALAQRGWTISLDINLRPQLAGDLADYRAAVWAALARAHWVKASDEDLAVLMDLPRPPRLDEAEALWPRLQRPSHRRGALTFGAQGAWLTVAGDRAALPACAVQVVDTVGAGDTFWGTCLADWLADPVGATRPQVEQTLRRALRAAALNCSRAGCQPPTRAELDAAGG